MVGSSPPASPRPRPRRRARLAASVGAVLATLALWVPAPRAQEDGDSTSLIRDTEIEEILHEDADPIFIAAGINPKAVTLHIIGSNDLQAFVSGGQQMFV